MWEDRGVALLSVWSVLTRHNWISARWTWLSEPLMQLCLLHCLLHWADRSDNIHMYELPLSQDCTGASSGLIQHMWTTQRLTMKCEGIHCFRMRDDLSDLTEGMCAVGRLVGGRHWAVQGGGEEGCNSWKVRAIGCVICCLRLLGTISRQQPQPQDARERGQSLSVSKKSVREARKLMRRTVI